MINFKSPLVFIPLVVGALIVIYGLFKLVVTFIIFGFFIAGAGVVYSILDNKNNKNKNSVKENGFSDSDSNFDSDSTLNYSETETELPAAGSAGLELENDRIVNVGADMEAEGIKTEPTTPLEETTGDEEFVSTEKKILLTDENKDQNAGKVI